MQNVLRKFFKTLTWTHKMALIVAQWPMVIIVLGVAITPVWAGVLIWFLFHWLVWQVTL